MGWFDLVVYELSQKSTFVDFNIKGNKIFIFWIGILSQKSEFYEPP